MIGKGIHTALVALNDGIDAVVDYIKNNGVAIAVMVSIVWFFKSKCKKTKVSFWHVQLGKCQSVRVSHGSF
jgi:hypothetical protein